MYSLLLRVLLTLVFTPSFLGALVFIWLEQTTTMRLTRKCNVSNFLR